MLAAAGFVGVSVAPKPESREFIKNWLPGSGCEDFVVAATVKARKPGGGGDAAAKPAAAAPPAAPAAAFGGLVDDTFSSFSFSTTGDDACADGQ